MKKYRLKIDYNSSGKFQYKKGQIFERGEQDYFVDDKENISLFHSWFVENNPDIFEEIKPIEIEGEISPKDLDDYVITFYRFNNKYSFSNPEEARDASRGTGFLKAKLIIEE